MGRQDQVRECTLRHLRRLLKIDANEPLIADRRLTADLGLKSLQTAALVTNICADEAIDPFSLSDVDLVKMKTIGDVVAILASKPLATED